MALNISVCMIVKNEANRIERCIKSIESYGFEIVIVDTGSTDTTKEIAHKYTDKVFDYAWTNDFSAARNYSLQMASNDWIFMLDSDEWVEDIDVEELLYFKKNLSDAMGAVSRHNINGTPDHPTYSTDRTERFFNRKKYHYTGIIHEQLSPKYNFNVECLLLNTNIGHDGYCMSDEARLEKATRNISMLLEAHQKSPDDPYLLYQLGKGYDILNDYGNSIDYYMQALNHELDFSLAYVQALFTCCMEDMLQAGRNSEALNVLNKYPEITDFADYYYVKGLVLKENGLIDSAIDAFTHAMTFDFATRTGANSSLAQHMLDKLSCPFSICMIVKNEEKNIDAFLIALKEHIPTNNVDIVIVDTGSTDTTKDIIAKHGIIAHDFEWINDFSAARNYSLSLAQNDYVLILDCDEFITDLSYAELTSFIRSNPYSVGMLRRQNHYIENNTDTVYTDQVERLFNKNLYNYEGIIHEQVVPVSSKADKRFISISLEVNHTGYILSADEMKKKANRNIELLLTQLNDSPSNPYIYFQLGQAYNSLHDDVTANYYYGKGLEMDVDSSLEYVQMMVIEYGYTLLHLDRASEALSYEGIYDEFCHSADFLILMGLIYMRNGQLLKAMQEFVKAISTPEHHVNGANTFIPRYNIGLINEMLGQTEDAIKLYQACGNFKPALDRLTELSNLTN